MAAHLMALTSHGFLLEIFLCHQQIPHAFLLWNLQQTHTEKWIRALETNWFWFEVLRSLSFKMKHFFEFVVFSMISLKSSTYLFSLFFRKCTHFWSFDVECSVSVSRLSICWCFTTKHGRFGTVGILLANWWNFCRLWMGVRLCVRHNDLDGSKYLQWQRISKQWEKPCKNVCIKRIKK